MCEHLLLLNTANCQQTYYENYAGMENTQSTIPNKRLLRDSRSGKPMSRSTYIQQEVFQKIGDARSETSQSVARTRQDKFLS